MEARQLEPNSTPVQSILEDFFANQVYDGRYSSSDYHSCPTIHAIEVDPIQFSLPALKNGSVYRINHALLYLSVKITKEDGNKPADSSNVALANDAINSLFAS